MFKICTQQPAHPLEYLVFELRYVTRATLEHLFNFLCLAEFVSRGFFFPFGAYWSCLLVFFSSSAHDSLFPLVMCLYSDRRRHGLCPRRFFHFPVPFWTIIGFVIVLAQVSSDMSAVFKREGKCSNPAGAFPSRTRVNIDIL